MYRGGAPLPYPARRAPGGARREAGAGPRTWERAGAVGRRRRGVEAGGSPEPGAGSDRTRRGPWGRGAAGSASPRPAWQRLGLALRGFLARPPRPRASLALAPRQGPPLPLLGFLPGRPPTPRQHPALPSCTPLFPRQHPRRPGSASRHRLDPRVLRLRGKVIRQSCRNNPAPPSSPHTPRFAVCLGPQWGLGLSAN